MKLKNSTFKTDKMKCLFHVAMCLKAKKVTKARIEDERWGREWENQPQYKDLSLFATEK